MRSPYGARVIRAVLLRIHINNESVIVVQI